MGCCLPGSVSDAALEGRHTHHHQQNWCSAHIGYSCSWCVWNPFTQPEPSACRCPELFISLLRWLCLILEHRFCSLNLTLAEVWGKHLRPELCSSGTNREMLWNRTTRSFIWYTHGVAVLVKFRYCLWCVGWYCCWQRLLKQVGFLGCRGSQGWGRRREASIGFVVDQRPYSR